MTDFWSKRLGAPVNPAPRPPVSASPVPPQFRAATPATEQYVAPASQGASEAPRQAQSARQHDACPACGSGNYMAPPGGRARCFECGYPVEQSTSGAVSTTSQGAAAVPAQQATGYSGGFQPNVIVNK